MTLTLDAAWQPISIFPADRGFSMVYAGRAQAVENYSAMPCALFYYPSVIVCKNYIRRRPIPLSPTRANIYWRDNLTCQYCGKTDYQRKMTLDHVIPKSRGGPKSWDNLVTCCVPCNQKKGDKTPSEASMDLFKEPRAPNINLWSSIDWMMRKHGRRQLPESWNKFLRSIS